MVIRGLLFDVDGLIPETGSHGRASVRRTRSAVVAAFLAAWLMPGSVASAATPDPADLPVAVGDAPVFDQVDGLQRLRMGTWSLVDRPVLTSTSVRIRLDIRPPATGLPGRSGPAVLFVRESLFGGLGGDMALDAPVRVATVLVPACSDAACPFALDVTLSTRPLRQVLRRYPKLENPMLVLSMTLVRTFGRGEWLQIVPLQPDQCLVCGGPQSGSIPSYGVNAIERGRPMPAGSSLETRLDWVAAVRRAIKGAADPSDAIPTVDAIFDASLHGCADSWTIAIHDADGNLPLLLQLGRPVPSHISERIRIPDRRTWTLTSEGSTGIFEFGAGQGGPGMDVGSFTTVGSDLRITTDLTCGPIRSGSMSVTPTTLPDTATVPAPPRESPRGQPVMIAALLAFTITLLAWMRRTSLVRA